MMEVLPTDSPEIFAAIWHEPLSPDDVRASLPAGQRDRIAGKRDVRLFARYRNGAKPVTQADLAEASTLGAGQWADFERIAIITDDVLMRHVVQFFAPFFHGPLRVYSNAQANEARLWLKHHGQH